MADAIPIVVKAGEKTVDLPVGTFYEMLMKQTDILAISDSHYEGDMKHLGAVMPDLKKGGAGGMFIESPKEKQARLDAWRKSAKGDDPASFWVLNTPTLTHLLQPSRQCDMPLFCMDKNGVDKKNELGDLGKGNKEEQARVFEAYAKIHGREKATKDLEAFRASRVGDNKTWIENIKDTVKEHNLKKFVIVGGGHHFETPEAVHKAIGTDQKLKTTHIMVKGEKNRIISPIIFVKGSGLGGRGSDVDYTILLPDDITLSKQEVNTITKNYDVLYQATATYKPDMSMRSYEFAKWKHAHAVMGLNDGIKAMDAVVKGKDEEFKAFEKAYGAFSMDDKMRLEKVYQNLRSARSALDEPNPNFASAIDKIKQSEGILRDEFMGGAKAFREKSRKLRGEGDQAFMLVESLVMGMDNTIDNVKHVQGYTEESFKKIAPQMSVMPALSALPVMYSKGIERR